MILFDSVCFLKHFLLDSVFPSEMNEMEFTLCDYTFKFAFKEESVSPYDLFRLDVFPFLLSKNVPRSDIVQSLVNSGQLFHFKDEDSLRRNIKKLDLRVIRREASSYTIIQKNIYKMPSCCSSSSISVKEGM